MLLYLLIVDAANIQYLLLAKTNLFYFSMQYYKYVLETPYALTGTHNLAKATAKGSTVVLFVASANDKQCDHDKQIEYQR